MFTSEHLATELVRGLASLRRDYFSESGW